MGWGDGLVREVLGCSIRLGIIEERPGYKYSFNSLLQFKLWLPRYDLQVTIFGLRPGHCPLVWSSWSLDAVAISISILLASALLELAS